MIMNGNTALNALYRQYEEEKLRLELYGHISSLTFEEWLEVKQHKENSLEDERSYRNTPKN